MEIIQNHLTKNNCYKKGQTILIKGIMIHSTACPNVPAINFVKSWNTDKPNGRSVCVHAFMDDKEIYQTLPWNYQGWHAGGNANNELIGIELCEPKDYNNKEYFETIKKRALELCVFLCKKYNLEAESITTHCEGYAQKGKSYASNHSDIHHWWKVYHNYTIDDFRKELKEKLEATKIKKEFKTGKDALDYLVETGRITEKEQWQHALDLIIDFKWILIKWAQDVSKLHEIA